MALQEKDTELNAGLRGIPRPIVAAEGFGAYVCKLEAIARLILLRDFFRIPTMNSRSCGASI